MEQQTVLVTGISGNLGVRLLPLLTDYRVVGVDMHEPTTAASMQFASLDLGREDSCAALVRLLREHKVDMVVHLAFVLDGHKTGVLDLERMWQINVAGTARVMEAITEINRLGGNVRKFIFPGSVSAYGPETPPLVKEDFPLGAESLPYALHKKEADEVVRYRADTMGDCTTYILRAPIFSGATMQNYLVGALRGTPGGPSPRAQRMRAESKRLPLMLPFGERYLQKKFQFVHVDDMARLLAWLLHHEDRGSSFHVLNVAAPGEPISLAECAQLAHAKTVRVPGRWACRMVLQKFWDWGLSSIPPEALPYMIGSYTMDTSALKKLLGEDYKQVMRYNMADALSDSFHADTRTAAAFEQSAGR